MTHEEFKNKMKDIVIGKSNAPKEHNRQGSDNDQMYGWMLLAAQRARDEQVDFDGVCLDLVFRICAMQNRDICRLIDAVNELIDNANGQAGVGLS